MTDRHLEAKLSKMRPIAADTIRKWYAKTDPGPPPIPVQPTTKKEPTEAESLLTRELSKQEQRSTVVIDKAHALGLSPTALRRAKDRLSISAFQRAGEWFWRLP